MSEQGNFYPQRAEGTSLPQAHAFPGRATLLKHNTLVLSQEKTPRLRRFVVLINFLFVHYFQALREELRCLFHCVDADAFVDGVDTFLVVQRHQKRGEAINVIAHVAVIAAVAVCDEHIGRGDHCRENLFDCDVQVVPRFDVDG